MSISFIFSLVLFVFIFIRLAFDHSLSSSFQFSHLSIVSDCAGWLHIEPTQRWTWAGLTLGLGWVQFLQHAWVCVGLGSPSDGLCWVGFQKVDPCPPLGLHKIKIPTIIPSILYTNVTLKPHCYSVLPISKVGLSCTTQSRWPTHSVQSCCFLHMWCSITVLLQGALS
jgi:hypothetical protein